MAGANAWSLRIFILIVAVLERCDGFCLHLDSRALAPHHGIPNTYPRLGTSRLHLSSDGEDGEKKADDDKDDERDSYTWAQLQADEELRKLEFDSSTSMKNKMFLPQRISKAVTTLGWTFVIGGIILNSLGYAWVKDPSGGLGVGTLDERDFQREVMRERRTGLEEEKPDVSISKVGGMDNHIFNWVEQEQDSQSV